ncbi:TspO/MBR family-domain-containing protein [Xylariaceae sp. FL1651]|nr:TspO/MBR family-domain-containing protein [Xylariaceae sp. FL1651]
MQDLPQDFLKFKESFLQIDPSLIPEIVVVFIGGSRLYAQERPMLQSDYDGLIVVKSKQDIFSLINERERRQSLVDLVGIKHEECVDLQIPSCSSPLWPEFDAVRFAGHDKSNVKRSVKILSPEYFSENRTSLNLLSYKDRRVHETVGSSSMTSLIVQQATTLPKQLLVLHDPLLYSTPPGADYFLGAFGATTDLLVSGACVFGNLHGYKIKKMLVGYYASMTGTNPTLQSFHRCSRFSPLYTNWFVGELAELCRTSPATVPFNPKPKGAQKQMILFGKTSKTQVIAGLGEPLCTRELPREALRQFNSGHVTRQLEDHSFLFSFNSSPYRVTTRGPGKSIDIFIKESAYGEDETKGAKLASKFFHRVTVRCVATSGEPLYPFFQGITKSAVRLAYIQGGRHDQNSIESLLYVELVQAEDTLRAYRNSLPLQTNDSGSQSYIQGFFYDRLINDKRICEFYEKGMNLAEDSVSLERLLSLRWNINGQNYPSLREAFNVAKGIVAPDSSQVSSCPVAFGLGDCHGGNVMLCSRSKKAAPAMSFLFDFEVVGFHPVVLDLVKPLYHAVFFETLHYSLIPPGVKQSLKYHISGDTIVIEMGPQIDHLAQAIFDIKLRYLIEPLGEEVHKLGKSLGNYIPLLSSALFLCATVARKFSKDEAAFMCNFATGMIIMGAQSWEDFGSTSITFIIHSTPSCTPKTEQQAISNKSYSSRVRASDYSDLNLFIAKLIRKERTIIAKHEKMTSFIPRINTIPYDVFASPAASIILPIALGTAVGYSTRPKQTKETYAAMKQPPLRPPPYVFGPAWTLLYGLMGYAAHRAVVRASSPLSLVSADGLRSLYSLQLALNLTWMPIFFVQRRPVAALANIVSLIGLNGYLTYQYFGVDDVAGWCMVPYLAWLGFATYLNAGVGYLNNWDISESTLATRKALGKDI